MCCYACAHRTEVEAEGSCSVMPKSKAGSLCLCAAREYVLPQASCQPARPVPYSSNQVLLSVALMQVMIADSGELPPDAEPATPSDDL